MLGGDGGASSVAVPGCAWPQGQCFCLADIPAQQAPGGSRGSSVLRGVGQQMALQ